MTTVAGYLAKLPADRRAAIERVRETVNAHLPDGYEEGIQYGMISWYVPLSRYPDTYNGQPLAIASLASQKQYMALYLMSVYGDPEVGRWFTQAWKATGKKLDMGKSCVRFKTIDDLALEVVADAIEKVPVDRFLAGYEAVRATTSKAGSTRAVRTSRSGKKLQPVRKAKVKPKAARSKKPATPSRKRAARARSRRAS